MDSLHRFSPGRQVMRVVMLLAVVGLGAWGANSTGPASAASPRAASHAMTRVRIAFSTWTGYGPLVVAAQKNFFKNAGLDVSYTVVESATAREAALRANQLDGAATTVDTFTRWSAQGTPIQVILGIDRSAGGDGIVAKKSITTVKQLRGRTVAVAGGTVSEFFFDYVLHQNGMTIKDVKIRDMPDSSVAGSTFAAGRVDAAVTWEPWLTRAAHTSFGHILVSSARYPNIIVDAFALRTDFIRAHTAAVRNFVRAYYQAVNFTESHPAAANQIIGKYVSETPAQVSVDLTKVPLMNLAISKAYFGTARKQGPIYKTARSSSNFWLRLKVINKMPNIRSLINPSFLQAM
jgi:NitT/TauT family transport system substrate-binding protein